MYLGIDVGGTNLKAGLVDENGRILQVEREPLGTFAGGEALAAQLAGMARRLLDRAGLTVADIPYVGIGMPGAVKGDQVIYTCNIPMKNVPFGDYFRRSLDVPVILENDANCAAVAEWLFGAGRGTQNFGVITLGTGVGGGFVLNGKLYTASGSATEVGHIVIRPGGELCGCGHRGCWEAYASATALIRETKKAMAAHPESALHAIAAENGGVEAKVAFDAAEAGDATALELCAAYGENVAIGLVNLVNILQPEVIALGGGVAAAPEALLLEPVQKYVAENCYAASIGWQPHICRAAMGNDAGLIGAALLERAI